MTKDYFWEIYCFVINRKLNEWFWNLYCAFDIAQHKFFFAYLIPVLKRNTRVRSQRRNENSPESRRRNRKRLPQCFARASRESFALTTTSRMSVEFCDRKSTRISPRSKTQSPSPFRKSFRVPKASFDYCCLIKPDWYWNRAWNKIVLVGLEELKQSCSSDLTLAVNWSKFVKITNGNRRNETKSSWTWIELRVQLLRVAIIIQCCDCKAEEDESLLLVVRRQKGKKFK